jgi:hypothetical protein
LLAFFRRIPLVDVVEAGPGDGRSVMEKKLLESLGFEAAAC